MPILRYVGVIWSIFRVLQLLPLGFMQRDCVALANLRRRFDKNETGNRTSLDLVMVIESACFLIP